MKNIVLTLILLVFSISTVEAQKTTKEDLKKSIYVKFKKDAKPVIFVDGKRFDFSIDLIDQNEIESVFIVKGEEAKKKYNAPNGAVLITTKKGVKSSETQLKFTGDAIYKSLKTNKKPLILIDGKVSNERTLKRLNTKDIEKIDIIKGDVANKKYNAPNGVILIITKKKKSFK